MYIEYSYIDYVSLQSTKESGEKMFYEDHFSSNSYLRKMKYIFKHYRIMFITYSIKNFKGIVIKECMISIR